MASHDDIIILVSKGLFEEAVNLASEMGDPLEQADSFIDIALGAKGSHPELVQDLLAKALKLSKKVKDPQDKVYLKSRLAYAHAVLGNPELASELFDSAAEEIAKIKSDGERAVATAVLAYHLALAGFKDEGLDTFNEAFDMAISAEMDYRKKLDIITEIANLLEAAGDELNSSDAVGFYEIAYDIFDKLRISQRAADLEKKVELAKTTYHHGTPEIRSALLEGRYQFAVKTVEKTLKDPQDRFIAILEIAHWMKKMGALEYLEVLEEAFHLLERIGLSDSNVQRAAAILTEMGELERALRFAVDIKDPEKKDEALAAVALKLAERKDFTEARGVAGLISDPMLKARLSEEIARMEERARLEF
ncbi:hypothetical protein A3L09_00195 [Thermococcus profundus]|uniref:Prenyltransferase n=2 Tax=Thermococcus profundus TaxID=49899 RepID=A0A2Z2MIE0_THEPR|nr:hypothetical protein A3L09_00195 [Thermococcus profundus]